MLPCPPAETAEINQYDLADALIDTEKSHREESLDPGAAEFVSLFFTHLITPTGSALMYKQRTEVV